MLGCVYAPSIWSSLGSSVLFLNRSRLVRMIRGSARMFSLTTDNGTISPYSSEGIILLYEGHQILVSRDRVGRFYSRTSMA